MTTNQLTKVLAGAAAGAMLWCGAAVAESNRTEECRNASSGVSLCGKVGTALHACVQDKTCGKQAAPKKRGKRGMGFLSRLFI